MKALNVSIYLYLYVCSRTLPFLRWVMVMSAKLRHDVDISIHEKSDSSLTLFEAAIAKVTLDGAFAGGGILSIPSKMR